MLDLRNQSVKSPRPKSLKRSVMMTVLVSKYSEYVRKTFIRPPDVAAPAKGCKLAVSIANYSHHKIDRGVKVKVLEGSEEM